MEDELIVVRDGIIERREGADVMSFFVAIDVSDIFVERFGEEDAFMRIFGSGGRRRGELFLLYELFMERRAR